MNLHCLKICFFLLLTIGIIVSQDQCYKNAYYFIAASSAPHLALDASNPLNVKLQQLNDVNGFQIFEFRCSTRIGTYKIINTMTGFFLTAENVDAYHHKVTITANASSPYQDWIFNSRGDIFNVALFGALGAEDEKVSPGVNLEVRVNVTTLGLFQIFTLTPVPLPYE